MSGEQIKYLYADRNHSGVSGRPHFCGHFLDQKGKRRETANIWLMQHLDDVSGVLQPYLLGMLPSLCEATYIEKKHVEASIITIQSSLLHGTALSNLGLAAGSFLAIRSSFVEAHSGLNPPDYYGVLCAEINSVYYGLSIWPSQLSNTDVCLVGRVSVLKESVGDFVLRESTAMRPTLELSPESPVLPDK